MRVVGCLAHACVCLRRLRFRFCYWLPSIVLSLATFSSHFLLRLSPRLFASNGALILTKTDTLFSLRTNLISKMNFPLSCPNPSDDALTIYLQNTECLHSPHNSVWFFSPKPFRTIIYNRTAAHWKKHIDQTDSVGHTQKRLEVFWSTAKTHEHTHPQWSVDFPLLWLKIRYKYFIMKIHSTDLPRAGNEARQSRRPRVQRNKREDEECDEWSKWKSKHSDLPWIRARTSQLSNGFAISIHSQFVSVFVLFSYAFVALHAVNGLLLLF